MAPDIEHGEKRVLMADGSFIGCYERQGNLDHRTNLAAGATPSLARLSTDEQTLCRAVAKYSLNGGARFIGIDLVYPYVSKSTSSTQEAWAHCSHLASL